MPTQPPTVSPPVLTAYWLNEARPSIEPAPPTRAWMDESAKRAAYRCLPLLVANQAGWIIRGGLAAAATWDGGPDPEHVRVECEASDGDPVVVSHFGQG